MRSDSFIGARVKVNAKRRANGPLTLLLSWLVFTSVLTVPSTLASAGSSGVTPLAPTCPNVAMTVGLPPLSCFPPDNGNESQSSTGNQEINGATLTGPGVLVAGKCKGSNVVGLWCTPNFTLALNVPTTQPVQDLYLPSIDATPIKGTSVTTSAWKCSTCTAVRFGNYAGGVLGGGGAWCPNEFTASPEGCSNWNSSSAPMLIYGPIGYYATMQICLAGAGTVIYANGSPAGSFTACTQIQIQYGSKSSSPTPRKHAGDIAISMVTTPATVSLAVDKSGSVTPKNVSVSVTLKNTTKKTIKGVQLVGLDPEPQDKTQSLNQLALPKKSIPLTFGTLAAGASLKKTFTLSVTGDGNYQWRALAQYNKPSAAGGNGFATATGGPFVSSVPPLFFAGKLEPDHIYKQGGAPWVKGGDTWYVTADVKNESAYKTLCVAPLVPTFKGNAAGIGPHDITVASPTQNAPPYAGTLAPGQSATVEMYVGTSTEGATRGEVTFAPSAATLGSGQTCNADTYTNLTPLASSDVTVPKDTGDFTVRVDTSVPTGTTNGPLSNALIFFGSIPIGAIHTLFDSAVSLEASAADAFSVQNLFTTLLKSFPPVAAARGAISSYQQLVVADEVMAHYWNTASPADKQNFLKQVASVLRREGGDFWSAASGTVSEAAQGYMNQVTQAYASGSDTAIFSLFGRSVGSGVAAVGTQIALAEAGTQILAKAPALQAAFEEVAGSSVTVAALKDMPPGKLLSFSEMQRLWGLSQDDLKAFAAIAKENDVLIGVRGRAPISVANLEEGAVWKHENLKPKNVNAIDIEYLGFPSSSDGLVQFRSYTAAEKSAILSRIESADLSTWERRLVMKRFNIRTNEAGKYLAKIEEFSKKGEINVGFNYADNGIQKATTVNVRKFSLSSETVEGGELYTPYQENLKYYGKRKGGALPKWCERALSTVLCRVTGDMDGVYITTTAGTNVPQAKLVQIYNQLMAAGWQHPETLTWVNAAGQFYFDAKADILSGLELGGEPMIEFAPNGKQYATYLDLAKSKLLSSDNYYLDVVGGYTTLATTGS